MEPQFQLGKKQGTPWTSGDSTIVPTRKQQDQPLCTLILILIINQESPISLMHVFGLYEEGQCMFVENMQSLKSKDPAKVQTRKCLPLGGSTNCHITVQPSQNYISINNM